MPGMVGRLHHATTRLLRRIDSATAPGRPLSGLTLPVIGGGVTFAARAGAVAQWREELGLLLDALVRRGTGLLLTVDEVHGNARDELRDLAATVRHLMGEDRDVALAMAGLPSAVCDLLGDDVVTVLRRATGLPLADVPLDAVSDALRCSVQDEGRQIDDDALEEASAPPMDTPSVIQLVGYHVWRETVGHTIDLAAVREGVPAAPERLGATVHEAALADLSDVDRTYLFAMAQDAGASSTGEIVRRLGQTPFYASTYRALLVAPG